MSTLLRISSVLWICIVLASCTDQPVVPDSTSHTRTTIAPENFPEVEIQRPSESHFRSVSRHIPQFGGYFIDKEGDVNVYVTDLNVGDAAATAVERIFENRPVDRRSPVTDRDIVVVLAEYTFADLKSWRDQILHEVLMNSKMQAVSYVDLDEGRNRVVIGILPDSDRENFDLELKNLEIPLTAIVYEDAAYSEPDSHNLRMEADTIESGLRTIYEEDDGTPWACTLGPLAEWSWGSGEWGFLTVSHCTTTTFAPDSSYTWQNTHDDPTEIIGQEIADPSEDCNKYPCRNSDAAWSEYQGSRHYGFALIARPVEADPVEGSIDIDHVYWSLQVSGDLSNPIQGELVNKIGQKTGWTYGLVQQTCVDMFRMAEGEKWFLACQDIADYGRDTGDSGSSVFIFEDGNDDAVWILGMHNGSLNGDGVFSSVANIEADLGTDLFFGPGLY